MRDGRTIFLRFCGCMMLIFLIEQRYVARRILSRSVCFLVIHASRSICEYYREQKSKVSEANAQHLVYVDIERAVLVYFQYVNSKLHCNGAFSYYNRTLDVYIFVENLKLQKYTKVNEIYKVQHSLRYLDYLTFFFAKPNRSQFRKFTNLSIREDRIKNKKSRSGRQSGRATPLRPFSTESRASLAQPRNRGKELEKKKFKMFEEGVSSLLSPPWIVRCRQ